MSMYGQPAARHQGGRVGGSGFGAAVVEMVGGWVGICGGEQSSMVTVCGKRDMCRSPSLEMGLIRKASAPSLYDVATRLTS